ncbi:MAG: DUF4349 domain-containing protein [Nitrososphaeria archaeon]|nr:DUF4349 domain-containing protein [Nitrososphaeria archaeon]
MRGVRKWWLVIIAVAVALAAATFSGFLVNTLAYGRAGVVVPISRQPTYVEPETAEIKTETVTAPQAEPPERGVEGITQGVMRYSEGERLIAYNADFGLKVGKGRLKEAVDRILSIANVQGGYLAFMSIGERDAYLTVKVPQNKFFTIIEELSRVGEVVSKSISGTDVTDQIIDLRARIKNAEALEASLLKLLEKAEKVGDILEVMRELSRVREEIEVMKAQLENLERSVAYSTITVRISEEEPKKEYMEIVFKALDSKDTPVPNTYLYVKGGEVMKLITDEFGEAKATFEKKQNITVIAKFYRSDGEILKTTLQEIADSNKTITIKFNKSSEPPTIDLDRISDAASVLLNYLVTGLVAIVILVIPIMLAVMALIFAVRLIYTKIKPK